MNWRTGLSVTKLNSRKTNVRQMHIYRIGDNKFSGSAAEKDLGVMVLNISQQCKIVTRKANLIDSGINRSIVCKAWLALFDTDKV